MMLISGRLAYLLSRTLMNRIKMFPRDTKFMVISLSVLESNLSLFRLFFNINTTNCTAFYTTQIALSLIY